MQSDISGELVKEPEETQLCQIKFHNFITYCDRTTVGVSGDKLSLSGV